MSRELGSLAVIAAIAFLAPIVVTMFRLRVPEVVLLLVGGIVVGPSLLGLVEVSGGIALFSEVGLGLLFFVAGYEVDLKRMHRHALRLGVLGWALSVAVAVAVTVALGALGVVSSQVAVAIAMTSTSLGTLLPILESRGLLRGDFRQLFFGAGFVGEFGPILAIALLLGTRSSFVSLITLAVFAAFVVVVSVLPRRLAGDPLRAALARSATSGSLTGVRLALLLLFALLALASAFGLDAVLGAFAGGAVLRLYSPDRDEHLQSRLEGVAFGLFVPLFFIISGANLDITAIVSSPLQVLSFFLLLLVARGLPQLLVYRRALPVFSDRMAFALYAATGLPIIVAVTTVAVSEGLMSAEGSAILIGAGALSVVVFPLVADRLLGARTPHVVLPAGAPVPGSDPIDPTTPESGPAPAEDPHRLR